MARSGHLSRALAILCAGNLLLPPLPSQALPTNSVDESAAGSPRVAAPAHKSNLEDQLQGDDRILHALNRFTFGPRPGDLEAVRAEGLERWFAQQLHPESIPNSALDAKLDEYPAMRLNPADLLHRLPSNGIIRQTIDGKMPMPDNPALRVVYENEIARFEIRKKEKEQAKQPTVSNSTTGAVSADAVNGSTMSVAGVDSSRTNDASATQTSMVASTDANPEAPPPTPAQIAALLALPATQRVQSIFAMPQPEYDSFFKTLNGPQKQELIARLTPTQKEYVASLENPQHVVSEEVQAARLTRDIYSNAQLQEVMTDFWLNHFNVFLHKNDETPYYLASYEHDVIRPRALGKFEDLLEATAHSPAMLLYLDNQNSTGPDSAAATKAKLNEARKPQAKRQAPEGLNENYARELMELHTLGVNGGYTQADVTEVARVLTGWTVEQPQRGGAFKFDENRHEPGVKRVLNKKIKEHGEQEGREVLHLLATRPATAKFIARKLAVRFVSDDPPQSLVDRMAKTFLSSHGDIAAVLKTLFHSPEFWNPSMYRVKIKTPLEYVASAARASNADILNMTPLVRALQGMGMPIYGAVPPTGYKWDAADWVSTGALVNRMNFALSMAANKIAGVNVEWSATSNRNGTRIPDGVTTQTSASGSTATPEAEEQRLASMLMDDELSSSTRAAVLEQFHAQINTPSNTQADAQSARRNPQASAAMKPMQTAARHERPDQAQAALVRQDQLLAGLLLGSPEFQRR